jgi:Tol biopolymer transport system component
VRRAPPRICQVALALLASASALPAAGGTSPPDAEGLPLATTRHIAFDTTEGTWLSLTLAPDGRRVVFDLLGDLYALDADGGTALPITRGLAFDSQPAYSPDGAWIAFISDRSGAENVWVARPDGSEARRITGNTGVHEYVSPAWSADGQSVFVSLYRSDRNAAELWRYDLGGRMAPSELTGGKFSALGAVASPDGRYLYIATSREPMFEDEVTLPRWRIDRLALTTGTIETVIENPGSAMRPMLSPDGRSVAYAARVAGETALRLRDLATGADRLIAYPVQRDAQEALPSRDLVPGYAFTRDGGALLASYGGTIHRVPLDGSPAGTVAFRAHVELDLGPSLRREVREPVGPVRARLIQSPVASPDRASIAFSALGRIYVQRLPHGPARLLGGDGPPQFEPAWFPDGSQIAYVTWDARTGGGLWVAAASGRGMPRPAAPAGSFYSDPAFGPDGHTLYALRSSSDERRHTYKEPSLWLKRSFGSLRQADLIAVAAGGGEPRIVASGVFGGPAHFVDRDRTHLYINAAEGLDAVALEGGARRTVVSVIGPGYYFLDGAVQADELRLSPDGHHVLALLGEQLHLLDLGTAGEGGPPIDVRAPRVPHRKLTSVGADFFGWSAGGAWIDWAVGSTYYRRPLASIAPGADGGGGTERPVAGRNGVEAFPVVIERPRDVPRGAIVLRGATVVTMAGDAVIADADLVVVDNRIAAVGRRGEVALPAGATVRELSGRFIVPGYIDAHDHFGDVRRGLLDLDNWGFPATLAYGVTSALDPSTLSIDMLAYQDLLDAGLCIGPRLYSTGPAVFSFNEFTSPTQAQDVLRRYAEHYRLTNLKEYRSGSRRVREWIAAAAADFGLVATTEGAVDLKLDLTQVLDGYAGNEHALAAVPLYRDVIELMARARTSYTPTLTISHGGPAAGQEFIAREDPLNDPKIVYFYPRFARERLFTRARWTAAQEHVYPAIAAGAAAIQRAGGIVAVGSHGNYPGIGFHFEMQAMASGGMAPLEVLRAATLGSAEAIGRASDLGSLLPGKFADLVVLGEDPRLDVHALLAIREVMKNGRLYDATTLAEEWPTPAPPPARWFADEPPASATTR